jgi:hypothetical protein
MFWGCDRGLFICIVSLLQWSVAAPGSVAAPSR